MKIKSSVIFLFLAIILLFSLSILAQSKKNSRPGNDSPKVVKTEIQKPVYFYEFAKDEFVIKKIQIEHDENGLGKITFLKKDFDEDIVEPLKLSPITLEKLKNNWSELNFLESDEVYQSQERDYGHLGTVKLKMSKDSRERSAEFNWTSNLLARDLASEYRKISNQFIWIFEINVARQNQPLESPKIVRALDSHLRRNAISDPFQMIPFLKELSEDERMPLIARNHAERLMKKISKDKKKKEEKEEKENKDKEIKEKGQ